MTEQPCRLRPGRTSFSIPPDLMGFSVMCIRYIRAQGTGHVGMMVDTIASSSVLPIYRYRVVQSFFTPPDRNGPLTPNWLELCIKCRIIWMCASVHRDLRKVNMPAVEMKS